SSERRRGELISVMGQSGCGKSTLIKTLRAEIITIYGEITLDGKNLYDNASHYTRHFGYVLQDDLLYPYLTVYENLWFRGRLRLPKLSTANLDRKINNNLQQTNLVHRRDTRVGDSTKKLFNGGERK
ncbi:MAG: ATP-binding cassette domain-containing protein, partial [Candidatus Cloacimonetes bacterium]|nr:ATP-binding cassette domain-containing protein [Candidatus Cloacimonadota bacterium]